MTKHAKQKIYTQEDADLLIKDEAVRAFEEGRKWEMRNRLEIELRDRFAAAALSGILANRPYMVEIQKNNRGERTPHIVAGAAYEYADALFAERERRLEA